MSLSTIYTHHPPICRHPRYHHNLPSPPEPPPINWTRIRHVTIATAVATFLSQIPSAPLDLATKLVQSPIPSTPNNLLSALVNVFKTHGFRNSFQNLPMACMKRIPTKALTVTFFELGTQILTRTQPICPGNLTGALHLAVAISSGALALASTFPLHSLYYANRKGVACSAVLSSFTKRWPVMFSGFLPALISTPPAVLIDYLVYRQLRTHIDQRAFPANSQTKTSLSSIPTPLLIVAAATTANLVGGAAVEPFKALSRRMAVESVKSVSCGSMLWTARTMLRQGVGEFWRGYPMRVARYAVSAVVSKTAVRQLRPKLQDASLQPSGNMDFVVAGKGRMQPRLAAAYPRNQWPFAFQTTPYVPF